jgi:hypothetical protein
MLGAIAVPAAVLALAPGGSAAGRDRCAQGVLQSWHDGRVSERYAPRCYRAALANLPEDMRIYSSAEDDIERALHTRLIALRTSGSGHTTGASSGRAPAKTRRLLSARAKAGAAAGAVADPAASRFPLPVVVAGASAAVLVALAGISRVARTLRRP